MKVTQKFIRAYVNDGIAEDLTHKSFEEINAIRNEENGFDTIHYSTGIYGANGVVLKGNKSGAFYAVTSRCTALAQVF